MGSYATVMKGNLSDQKPSALEIIPHHKSIEFTAANEKHSPLCVFRQAVRKAYIVFRLAPRREQENIDRDALIPTEQSFPQCKRLGARIWRVQQVQPVL